MTYAIISEKGQITLPSSIRKKANIHPGTRVEVELRGDEIIIHPVKPLHELSGVFHQYAVGKGNDYERIRESAMEEGAKGVIDEDQQ